MIWIISIVGIVYFFATIICAGLMASTAKIKGYDEEEMHLWAWCFWLGIFGYMYVLSLPDKILQSQNQQIIEQNQKIIELLKNNSVNKSVVDNDELPEL